MVVVELSGVSKSFRGHDVLSGVDLLIDSGRSYGLVGPNGSGKSLLLQIMCGLVRPDSGSVKIDPEYLSGDRTFPDRFGIAINGPAYLPGLSAMGNLLRLAAIRRRADKVELAETLTSLGLDPLSKQKVRNFSLGMRQKLSLAQAFIESPGVLLLDEPFNALDAESVANVSGLLKQKLLAGITIVMTSHHSSEIDSVCDTTLRIENRSVTAG
ncbi:MAG: ABC transporter ATP-binding protein [Acidobacteria bacterium]|nr:ABC transporter ATP-binding protein [Acidobacteriota bacterium]